MKEAIKNRNFQDDNASWETFASDMNEALGSLDAPLESHAEVKADTEATEVDCSHNLDVL